MLTPTINPNGIFAQGPSPTIGSIVEEMASMMGHFAAALLQISNPRVAEAIINHSLVTRDPVERGRRSLVYIYCMVFGTAEERQNVLEKTRLAHKRVATKNSDVYDSDLQLWIAATIYWSSVTSYENVYGKFKIHEANAIYKEFSILATGLNVPKENWPEDLAAFELYWDSTILSFPSKVTPRTKALADFIMRPHGLFLKAFPMWLFMHVFGHAVKTITIEMLPDNVRAAFSMPSTRFTRMEYRAIMRSTRMFYPLLPRRCRHIVKTFYLGNMRDRQNAGAEW